MGLYNGTETGGRAVRPSHDTVMGGVDERAAEEGEKEKESIRC